LVMKVRELFELPSQKTAYAMRSSLDLETKNIIESVLAKVLNYGFFDLETLLPLAVLWNPLLNAPSYMSCFTDSNQMPSEADLRAIKSQDINFLQQFSWSALIVSSVLLVLELIVASNLFKKCTSRIRPSHSHPQQRKSTILFRETDWYIHTRKLQIIAARNRNA